MNFLHILIIIWIIGVIIAAVLPVELFRLIAFTVSKTAKKESVKKTAKRILDDINEIDLIDYWTEGKYYALIFALLSWLYIGLILFAVIDIIKEEAEFDEAYPDEEEDLID